MIFGNVFTGTIDSDFLSNKKAEDTIRVITISDSEYYNSKNPYILLVLVFSFIAMFSNLLKGLFRKIFRERDKPFPKLFWDMGRDKNHKSGFFIDKFSPLNHYIKVKAASSVALDILYDWEDIRKKMGDDLGSKITKFWFDNMANRKALSNRKKVVSSLLVDAIDAFIDEPEVRIISIASGSARAVIEAVKECKHENVRVILIDKDEEAILNAKRNAFKSGLFDKFEFICDSTRCLENFSDFRPHIVEMVGLVDYYSNEKASKLIARVRKIMLKSGFFITGNINKNPEKLFLDWGLLWPMCYKCPDELKGIMINAGFSPEKVSIFYEPLKIHGVSIAQK